MDGQKEYPALVRTVVLKQEEQHMLVVLLSAGLTKASVQGTMFIFMASNLNTAVNIFTYIIENPVRRLLLTKIHEFSHHPLYWPQVTDFSLVFKQLLAVCYSYSLHHESFIGLLVSKSNQVCFRVLVLLESGLWSWTLWIRFTLSRFLYFAPLSFASTLITLPVLAAEPPRFFSVGRDWLLRLLWRDSWLFPTSSTSGWWSPLCSGGSWMHQTPLYLSSDPAWIHSCLLGPQTRASCSIPCWGANAPLHTNITLLRACI